MDRIVKEFQISFRIVKLVKKVKTLKGNFGYPHPRKVKVQVLNFYEMMNIVKFAQGRKTAFTRNDEE